MLRCVISHSLLLPTFTDQLVATTSALFAIQRRFRRRTLTPPPWTPPIFDENLERLSPDTEALLEDAYQKRTFLHPGSPVIGASSIVNQPSEWVPNSKRVGVIARKIGIVPQWLKDGTRMLCTMLHIEDNHVVSVVDPNTWYRMSSVGKKKAFNRFGTFWKITVGAVDVNPHQYSEPYRRIFERIGVPVKDRLAGFMVTGNSIVAPGTKLYANHFQIGQYVTVTGKSIDWGFQGAMHRWGFKGQPGSADCTKSHRRLGSTGSKGDARVWPGKRMHGHMGFEWIRAVGLQIIRMNLKEQVIYVRGCVPGETNQLLLMNDCFGRRKGRRVENPPFPTYFPPENQSETTEAATSEPEPSELWMENVFRFSSPSIVYTAEDEKKAARDKTRAKTAKVKK